MDVARPLDALLPGVDSAVIRALVETNLPRTGREIARAAERSHPAVQSVLSRFVSQGVVIEEPAGRARVYALNRDHLVAPAFQSLASLRLELFERISGELDSWTLRPVHASAFGSAARGDGDEDSDIDLFIVKPEEVNFDDSEWNSQVHDLSDSVFRWTGNHAGISVVDERNLVPLRSGPTPVADDIASHGIHLFGERIGQILGGR